MALAGGIGEEHPHLAVVPPAQCARVLPPDSGGVGPLLGKAGVVEDQDSTLGAQMFPHEPLQLVDAALVIPGGVAEKFLQPADRDAHLLGHVLHVLALNREHQSSQVALAGGPPLRPAEEACEALVEALQFRDRRLEVLSIHRRCPRDGHHGWDVRGGRCPPPTITGQILL